MTASPTLLAQAPGRLGEPARPAPGYALAAAHGGSGTSTLAALLNLAGDPGLAVEPGTVSEQDFLARPRRVLVVARTHAAGLNAAALLLDRLKHHHPVLALVADAPAPHPQICAYRIRVLAGRGPLVRIDYLAALRAADELAQIADQPRTRRLAAHILDQLTRAPEVAR